MKTYFYDYTFDDLVAYFHKHSLPPSGANLLYNWHYKKNNLAPCTTDLAKITRAHLDAHMDFSLPLITSVHQSEDKTVKFLMTLTNGQRVETVLIPFHKKYSICLSSQVGCAMNCSFCFTGTQGLKRNLSTHEIIGQLIMAKQWLNSERPTDNKILNIVFMGQGEPLHNFDAVKNACKIFLSNNGLCFAAAKITVSTSGYVPGLMRWKDEMPNVNIALSLHSTLPEKRSELIPLNKKYPLDVVMPLVEAIPYGKNRFVTYEYLLAKDFNDSEQDAHATGAFLQGKNAYISLIPFNPFPGARYKKPSTEKVHAFKAILDSYNIPTLIRTTKGDEILAACGQLNSSNGNT
jgi:23S rRNA (adenine2503-C2)-methyltransferase